MVDRYVKFATEHLANAASQIDILASENNVINLSRFSHVHQMKKGLTKVRPYKYWWWSLALHRTSLNNACVLLRKHAELCGFALLPQPFLQPGSKAPFALFQQRIRQPLKRFGTSLCQGVGSRRREGSMGHHDS